MGKLEYFKELEYRLRGLPERERQNIIAVYEELFQKAEANGKSERDIVDSLGFPRVPNWDALSAPSAGPQGGAAGAAGAGTGAAPQASAAGPGAAPGLGAPGRDAPSYGASGGFGGGYAAAPMRPPADPLRDPRSGFTAPTAPPMPPQYYEPGFAPPPYRAPMGSGVKPMIAGLSLGFFNLVFILGPFLGLCAALFGCWVAAVALVLSPLLLLSPLLGLSGTGFPHGTTLLLSVFGSMASFGAGLMLAVVLQFVTKWFFKLTCKYIKFNWIMIKGA